MIAVFTTHTADVSPVPIHATDAQSRPSYQGHGGKAPTSPHNSTAQYRNRTPSGTRPFTPTGTSKPAFSGSYSSPVGRDKATKVGHSLLVETVVWPKDTKAPLGHPPRPVLLHHTGVLPRTDMTKVVPTHPIDRNITTKASAPLIIDLHPIQGTNMAHTIDRDLSPRA